MRKYIYLLSLLLMIGMSGCTQSDDIGDDVDAAFLMHVQTGLERTWEKQSEDVLSSIQVDDVEDLIGLNEIIEVEYEQIKPFQGKEFTNQELAKVAHQYMDSVTSMYEDTSKRLNELNEDTLQSYRFAHTQRLIAIYLLSEYHHLTVNPDVQDILDSMVNEGLFAYEKEAKAHVNSGTYLVGDTLPAGEYIAFVDRADRSASLELRKTEYKADYHDVITSKELFDNTYITVSDGQYLALENCLLYPITDAPHITIATQRNQMLKVGRDIEPGNYEISPIENNIYRSYFAISELSTVPEIMYDRILILEVNFSEAKKVQLKHGQYVQLFYCILTKKE